MIKEEYICDVCEIMAPSKMGEHMQVIFVTEQTEGRSVPPHFSAQKLDLCGICRNKALEGNYIFAKGAQGFNKYYFKNS